MRRLRLRRAHRPGWTPSRPAPRPRQVPTRARRAWPRAPSSAAARVSSPRRAIVPSRRWRDIASAPSRGPRWRWGCPRRSAGNCCMRRWHNVPVVVRANEARRLRALVIAWLALERERAPFAVREVEAQRSIELGQLTFRLRLDRVDALAGGGLAILDYKSGRVESLSRWFDTRPQASQL